MKNFLTRFVLISLTVLSCLSQTVHAQNEPPPPPQGEMGGPGGGESERQLLNDIKNLITKINQYLGINLNFGQPGTSSTLNPNPNAGNTQNNSQNLTPPTPNIMQTQLLNLLTNQNFQGKTVIFYKNTYNPNFDVPPPFNTALPISQQTVYNNLVVTQPENIEKYMADLGISAQAPSDNVTLFSNNSSGISPNPNDQTLNFETLLGPIAYTNNNNTQQTQTVNLEDLAINFIRFLSGQASPPMILNSKIMARIPDAQRNHFIITLRNYIAAQSVGSNNLYQMLAQRHVYPGLGSRMGLRAPDSIQNDGTIQQGAPINDASVLQAQNYIEQRRTLSPKWYQDMEKAPPITIARETLYVLAEIENQLNQTRQMNERILATLSAIELIEAQKMKEDLNKQYQDIINENAS